MDFVITFGAILLSLCMLLTIGILFFGFVKYIKNHYSATSNFAGNENIVAPEYVYRRFAKRAVR